MAAGVLTRGQLRGPKVQRVFQGVYAFAGEPMTHELRCAGAALALPASTVITGRSAAGLWGIQLARAQDPVEIVAPETIRIARRGGLDVRRSMVRPGESVPWSEVAVATPLRMALDLLLDRPLPDAVADLDAVLRDGLVALPDVTAMVARRGDKGIVAARRAVQLADPRAESRPESRVRVWLVLDGLHPEPQYWIEDSRGPVARADLAFPEHKVAVEYDGSWRDGQLWALNHDRNRLNRVQAAGWEVVFVTAQSLHDPPRMLHTIRAALNRHT
ncbi:MAG: endonuclease domain-containing protein [Pseudonocardiales bacterium]